MWKGGNLQVEVSMKRQIWFLAAVGLGNRRRVKRLLRNGSTNIGMAVMVEKTCWSQNRWNRLVDRGCGGEEVDEEGEGDCWGTTKAVRGRAACDTGHHVLICPSRSFQLMDDHERSLRFSFLSFPVTRTKLMVQFWISYRSYILCCR